MDGQCQCPARPHDDAACGHRALSRLERTARVSTLRRSISCAAGMRRVATRCRRSVQRMASKRLPETEHALNSLIGEQLLVPIPHVRDHWPSTNEDGTTYTRGGGVSNGAQSRAARLDACDARGRARMARRHPLAPRTAQRLRHRVPSPVNPCQRSTMRYPLTVVTLFPMRSAALTTCRPGTTLNVIVRPTDGDWD